MLAEVLGVFTLGREKQIPLARPKDWLIRGGKEAEYFRGAGGL